MRSTFFVSGLISFSLLFFLSSCGDDNKVQLDLLQGKWTIDKAFRGERKTELLKDLFFEFHEDGKMMVNISGKPEQTKYELIDGVIHQTESSLDIDYQLKSLTDSTLVLQTVIRNIPFEFYLVKSME